MSRESLSRCRRMLRRGVREVEAMAGDLVEVDAGEATAAAEPDEALAQVKRLQMTLHISHVQCLPTNWTLGQIGQLHWASD